jgi:hypothetical protein
VAAFGSSSTRAVQSLELPKIDGYSRVRDVPANRYSFLSTRQQQLSASTPDFDHLCPTKSPSWRSSPHNWNAIPLALEHMPNWISAVTAMCQHAVQ